MPHEHSQSTRPPQPPQEEQASVYDIVIFPLPLQVMQDTHTLLVLETVPRPEHVEQVVLVEMEPAP